MAHFLVLLLALLLDRVVGDPPWLWRRLKHPVVLFGAAIAFADRRFNRPDRSDEARRRAGILAILALLGLSALAGLVLHGLFAWLGVLGLALEIVLVAVLLAQKSLSDHVRAVADGLRATGEGSDAGLQAGRHAVSMIVGRDPATLDEAGVTRAAIESLAENFADGVVAPALWYAIAGLPGILAYKMLNTADSMIGHKTERYLQFGRASAKLDDLANWPAARLSLLVIAVGAWLSIGRDAASRALSVGLADHGLHRSPNSGWPEAAFAGALDLGLAGPRVYSGDRVSEPMINASGRLTASAMDIDRAVKLFWASASVLTGLALLALVMAMLV